MPRIVESTQQEKDVDAEGNSLQPEGDHLEASCGIQGKVELMHTRHGYRPRIYNDKTSPSVDFR